MFPVGAAVLLDLRRWWKYAAATLAVVIVVAGWWYARNAILYGDPTGMRAEFEASQPHEPIRHGRLAPAIGLKRLPFAYGSFWAGFGDGRIPVGPGIRTLFDALTLVTLAGLGVWLVRGVRQARRGLADPVQVRQAIMLGMFVLGWLLALLYYASRAWNGAQGRYLLGGLAVWSAMVAAALDVFTPRRVRLHAALSGSALFAAVAMVGLFGYYLPAYRVLPLPQAIAAPLDYRYGDAAQLIGISPAQVQAHPGDTVTVDLYWRVLRPTDVELNAYLHSVDSDVVRRDSYPATGNLLSTDWQAGQTWTERYVLLIPADAPQQAVYPLIAGLYEVGSEQPLPVTDAAGDAVTPIVGRIAINGAPRPVDVAYTFGGAIGLAEPSISRSGDTLTVCLRWASIQPVAVDYKFFVHALRPDGTLITQQDGQGAYPSGAWTPGEAVDDCVTLDASQVPPTGYRVAVGLYNPTDLVRLPVVDLAGNPLPDDRVLIDR